MKKILLFLSLFVAIKASAQISPPVSPQAVTQMSWYREPSTNKMFANRGATLGWWQPTDSLQVIRIINSLQPATLTFGNGIAKIGSTVGLGSADGSNGLSRTTIIAQNGNLFAIGETSLTPNGGQQLSLLNKSFALTSAEDTLFSTVGAGTGTISARGVQVSANKFNPTTGQVLAKQVLSITGSSMVILDQIRNKGLIAGGRYEKNYTGYNYTTKFFVDSLDINNVKLTGASNQTINDGIRIYNAATAGYTLAIQGMGISNSDYQITTNGSNAFFNTFVRNGVAIVGMSGNTIATFNDHNGLADNPNINLFFPTTAPSFIKSGGTSGQYLMADGSVTTAGGGSGFAIKDSVLSLPKNGNDILSKSTFRANLGVSYATWAEAQLAYYIACWGDSLTQGANGGGNTYPISFTLLSGINTLNYGIGGNTSTQVLTRFLADPADFNKPTIIWCGRNNYLSPATVLADIKQMTDTLTAHNTPFLVVGIINGAYSVEKIGTTNYNTIISLNGSLQTTYGIRYVDVRGPLVAAYNPALPQDVIDHANDQTPQSLRTTGGVVDSLHINTTGYSLVGQVVYGKINLLIPQKVVTANILSNYIPKSGGIFTGAIQTTNVSPSSNGGGSVGLTGFRYGQGYINTLFANSVVSAIGDLNLSSQAASNVNIQYGSTGTTGIKLYGTNGHVVVQSGGTFTDAGYQLDVIGKGRYTGSSTAASAIARGLFVSPTLVAAANNDVLVGLDVVPTFTPGAFTGVTSYAIRTTGSVLFNGSLTAGASTFTGNVTVPALIATTVIGNGALALTSTASNDINISSGSTATLRAKISGSTGLLQLPAYTTAGLLQNDASGNITSTLVLPATTTATTQTLGDNTTKVATTAFVKANSFANPMTTLGDIIYGGASGVATRLAGNTTTAKQFLTSTGAAGVATAPALFDLFGSSNSWSGVNAFNAQTDFFSSATFRGGTGISFYNTGNTFAVNATAPTLTAARAVTFQDKSGTIALTSDVNRSHTIFSPVTGGTVTTVNNQDNIINPAGTLATLTIALPASPVNNDKVYITFTQAVTAITYSGGTTVGVPLSATLGSQWFLTYDSGTTTWY